MTFMSLILIFLENEKQIIETFQSVIWDGMAKVVPYHVDAVETKTPAIMLTGAVLVNANLAGVEFTVMKVSM